MTPARISLALALLPHAGYTDPATAAQVRELLLAAEYADVEGVVIRAMIRSGIAEVAK